MAISTTLGTPTTLKKGQQISIKQGVSEVPCWNDSGLTDPHYQAMPREPENPKAQLFWAGIPSVKLGDGDYSVAVSRYESVRYSGTFDVLKKFLQNYAKTGQRVIFPDGEQVYILKESSFTEDNGNVVFQKLVWMKASDLVLGSYAQQEAIGQQGEQEDANGLKKIIEGKPPVLGNSENGNGGKGLGTWGIVGVVLLFLIGLIWFTVALIKKQRNENGQKSNQVQQSPVNIIRIPKT
jgi:hypothetical protein